MMFLTAITFVEVLKWIGYVLVAILLLMVMIMIHETGHYVAGKIFHFTILEYSIGFGPKIFQKELYHYQASLTQSICLVIILIRI